MAAAVGAPAVANGNNCGGFRLGHRSQIRLRREQRLGGAARFARKRLSAREDLFAEGGELRDALRQRPFEPGPFGQDSLLDGLLVDGGDAFLGIEHEARLLLPAPYLEALQHDGANAGNREDFLIDDVRSRRDAIGLQHRYLSVTHAFDIGAIQRAAVEERRQLRTVAVRLQILEAAQALVRPPVLIGLELLQRQSALHKLLVSRLDLPLALDRAAALAGVERGLLKLRLAR